MKQPNENDIEVHGYIDGELEGDALERFEQRLAADSDLRARVDSERRLRERTAACLVPEPAPEALRERIRELVRSEWDGAPGSETPADSGPVLEADSRDGDRVRRRFFFRVVGLAAGLLLLAALGSLLRKTDSDASGLPRLIRESVALFDEALASEVAAAEPESVPSLAGFRFERAFCKGKDSGGKLNPCFVYRGEGGSVGFFCLSDRLRDSDFVKYGRRTASYEGYTIVASGPPGMLNLWVAKEIEPSKLERMIQRTESGGSAKNDERIRVVDMTCVGCADHIMQAVRKLDPPVLEVWCDVPNQEVLVRRRDGESSPDRDTLVRAIESLGFGVDSPD